MILTALVLAATASPQAPDAAEPPYADPRYGRQMTVAEIRRDVVGNSWSWEHEGKRSFQAIGADGSLRGGTEGGRRYAIHWHLRDYDNLFCVDTGDAASSGCVQLLRRGQEVTFRRKDGVVELTATLVPGKPFG